MKNIHRINDFTLFKFIEVEDLMNFSVVEDEINLTNKHFIPVTTNIEQDDLFIANIIWESGLHSHTLNKIYSSLPLYVPPVIGENIQDLKYTNLHILIKGDIDWIDVFGLHVIVKNSKTNEILLSQNIGLNQFLVTGDKELVDGAFWMEECVVQIPTIKDIMSCAVTTIYYEDISNETGVISNFTQDFILLIDEKPIPDYIKTILSLDSNHFLKIQLKTDETKTLEKSILDYFDSSSAVIEISHVINYGNENLGYESIRVSNENNKYLPISIGLNLLPYLNPPQLVNIFVSSEIIVSNKLMKREASLNTELSPINPFLNGLITHPETNFPVEVTKVTEVVNTIIHAKESIKFVPVFQTVFADLVVDDLHYVAKDVYFDKIKNPCYMRINATDKNPEQIILSKTTSDHRIYFDLTEINPIAMDTTYELIDVENMKIITVGKMFAPK